MRKAGLRLDLAVWALRKRPQHPDAIVPGHPEELPAVRSTHRPESRCPWLRDLLEVTYELTPIPATGGTCNARDSI